MTERETPTEPQERFQNETTYSNHYVEPQYTYYEHDGECGRLPSASSTRAVPVPYGCGGWDCNTVCCAERRSSHWRKAYKLKDQPDTRSILRSPFACGVIET